MIHTLVHTIDISYHTINQLKGYRTGKLKKDFSFPSFSLSFSLFEFIVFFCVFWIFSDWCLSSYYLQHIMIHIPFDVYFYLAHIFMFVLFSCRCLYLVCNASMVLFRTTKKRCLSFLLLFWEFVCYSGHGKKVRTWPYVRDRTCFLEGICFTIF